MKSYFMDSIFIVDQETTLGCVAIHFDFNNSIVNFHYSNHDVLQRQLILQDDKWHWKVTDKDRENGWRKQDVVVFLSHLNSRIHKGFQEWMTKVVNSELLGDNDGSKDTQDNERGE